MDNEWIGIAEISMRSTIAVAAGIGVAIVAVIGVRLAGSIGHVRTLAASLPPNAAGPTNEVARPAAPTRIQNAIAGFATTTPHTEQPARAQDDIEAASGDEQILRWLAADPEFQRAADELLRDPDPAARRESAEFLRQLGVEVTPSDVEF
jgi:hypothetical protein